MAPREPRATASPREAIPRSPLLPRANRLVLPSASALRPVRPPCVPVRASCRLPGTPAPGASLQPPASRPQRSVSTPIRVAELAELAELPVQPGSVQRSTPRAAVSLMGRRSHAVLPAPVSCGAAPPPARGNRSHQLCSASRRAKASRAQRHGNAQHSSPDGPRCWLHCSALPRRHSHTSPAFILAGLGGAAVSPPRRADAMAD